MGEFTQLYARKPNTRQKNSTLRRSGNNFLPFSNSLANHILHLQKTIGNQAVQRLIKSGTLQTKLKISEPGDKYEQEADRTADAVMRMPELKTITDGGHENSIHPVCSECEKHELHRQPVEEEEEEIRKQPEEEEKEEIRKQPVEEEEEEKLQAKNLQTKELQAKELPGQTTDVTPAMETSINEIRSCGQPLHQSTRAFFEPRFGYDFSHVQIHRDTKASEMAGALNAKAFTLGSDIVFGADHYSPDTGEGKKLLAHELTHVIQQGKS